MNQNVARNLNTLEEENNFNLLEKIMNYNGISKYDIGNIKLENMADHPFKYLRGSAERYFKLFFESLEYSSKEFKDVFKDKTLITACTNDTHVSNFGFTGENSAFITNDFDEYLEGNPFMDVLRYTSSLKFFIDDINHKISKNNLELRVLYNLKDSYKDLSKDRIEEIVEDNELFLELIEKDLKEVFNQELEELQKEFKRYIELGIKNRIKIEKYIELEDIEDYFLKEYFSSIRKEKTLDFSKENKLSKFYEKSKEKNARENQLIKYTKLVGDKRVFNLENEKLIAFKEEKKEEIREALENSLNNNLEVVDIIRRKTAGVGSSHLDRYYLLVINKLSNKYQIIEMKEQLRPVSMTFKDEFTNYFDIDLDKYESIPSAQIHQEGVKLSLGEDFDKNIASLVFHEKSFILKTHFNSKQGFDEVKIFKYSKTQQDLSQFLKEYIKGCATALASSHINGLKVQIDPTCKKSFKKVKEAFKTSMKRYEKSKNLRRFLKSMTKNLSSLILDDYLLFSKEFNQYKGFVRGVISIELLNHEKLQIENIHGILKEIIYSSEFNKLLIKHKGNYRKFYNLVNSRAYSIDNETLEEYFEYSDFKKQVINLVSGFLKKEEPFLKGELRVQEKINYEETLKNLETIFR